MQINNKGHSGESLKMVDLIKMTKTQNSSKVKRRKKTNGSGSRCNWQWGLNLNQSQELREDFCIWGVADCLMVLLMLLNGKERNNEGAEKDYEGIWVGVGKSLLAFMIGENLLSFILWWIPVCTYCTGEEIEYSLRILYGFMSLGGEIPKELTLLARPCFQIPRKVASREEG